MFDVQNVHIDATSLHHDTDASPRFLQSGSRKALSFRTLRQIHACGFGPVFGPSDWILSLAISRSVRPVRLSVRKGRLIVRTPPLVGETRALSDFAMRNYVANRAQLRMGRKDHGPGTWAPSRGCLSGPRCQPTQAHPRALGTARGGLNPEAGTRIYRTKAGCRIAFGHARTQFADGRHAVESAGRIGKIGR